MRGSVAISGEATVPVRPSAGGREALEGVVGGLRVPVVLQEPRAVAKAALDRPGGARIAPVEPEDALHLPGLAMAQDQLVGPLEQLLLTGDALAEAEAVGGSRSPAELGEPQRLFLVAVSRHDA